MYNLFQCDDTKQYFFTKADCPSEYWVVNHPRYSTVHQNVDSSFLYRYLYSHDSQSIRWDDEPFPSLSPAADYDLYCYKLDRDRENLTLNFCANCGNDDHDSEICTEIENVFGHRIRYDDVTITYNAYDDVQSDDSQD